MQIIRAEVSGQQSGNRAARGSAAMDKNKAMLMTDDQRVFQAVLDERSFCPI